MAVVMGVITGLLSIFFLIMGIDAGIEHIKQQAFERGHMVQCVGKTGYYWECEE